MLYLAGKEADDHPVYEGEDGHNEHHEVPEPEEEKDLLVEHVYHQYALHRVVVYVP